MSARTVAAEVLVRVWTDGAFAAAALSAALSRGVIDERDRGLATELVYGVLRTSPYLERRLSEFAKLKQTDKPLLAHLLVAAYQLEFLDRVPAHAAVNEAVQLIGEARDKRVSGFANAVLRKLIAAREARLSLEEAIFQSTPSWIRKRLLRDVGEDEARMLLAPHEAPRPYLRVLRPEALSWLADKTEPCEGVPGAYRFMAGGDPRRLSGFQEGAFVVQELGAQLVAHALGAAVGERVLDVCAGRGQKTMLLAEQVGGSGHVVATDLHEHKMQALAEEAQRLGVSVETRAWDWTKSPPESFQGSFDRVLVDAPCSGVGTLRRRPEISRRLTAEDPARLGELQRILLENAARAVRPGGVLLFATCSVFSEEAEQVVEAVQESSERALRLESMATPVDSRLFPGGTVEASLRLLPFKHGTDGYFVARFRVD